MNTRKIVLTVLGILLIVVSIYVAKVIIDNKTTPRPRPEKVVKIVFADTVRNGIVPIIVAANGNVLAKRRVELYSEVQGVFLKGNKLFRTGQEYTSGEAIIRIDAAEYRASVQSAKSNLYNLITTIMPDLRLDYPEIYPKWQSFLDGFDINKTTPPLPEMTSEKEKFFITGRGVLTNFYNVKNLEERLYKYSISAPFTGILTDALVTEGTLVRAGQKLGDFIDVGEYELEVSVSKSYSDLLKIGALVELTNLDNTQTFQGKVMRINGRVDQATQTIKAYIEINDKRLSEGMYLEAHLNAKEEQNAIEIDRGLLLEDNKIFVVRDTILDVIDVDPVYFTDKKVVVKNVPDGDIIVSKPVVGAYVGMSVKIYKDKNATPETANIDKP